MVHLVIFINLFFIPLLPVYVLYRKKHKPLESNMELLFQYGIVAACNIPLTKVFIFLIRKIAGKTISIDSGYYTVAALLPTLLLIALYALYYVYPDHESWKEKIVQKGIKGVVKDLAPACILLFVSCFMLFIFEPILMYATNMLDFWFDFSIMIWPVLRIFFIFFLIGIVIILAVYNADLLISKRLLIYKGITLIGFTVFFLTYIQGNWLAGNLPVLEGEAIIWEDYGKVENVVLILFLAVLVITMITLIRKRGINHTVFCAATCALIVFVMLFASLVPTVISNKALKTKDSFSPTLKNFNTISSNQNFLILLVDSLDSRMCYDVMMEDADFREMMEDFTYYPDALSVYSLTRESIPNILTSTVYRNETDFPNYSSSAYNKSLFFDKLTQNGYEINLYSPSVLWEGKRNFIIENAASIYDNSIELNDFMKSELKYTLFKYLPYGLKQYSHIETLDFETCKISNSEYKKYTDGNRANYKRLTESNILDKQNENYFQFIHIEGSHTPFNMDKEMNSIEDGTRDQKIAAALTMIKTYLQRLKDNDAYDNSIIVILSDHGYPCSSADEEVEYRVLERFNPALFIKGVNEKHEMLESDRPVYYSDLQDAFCDLIEGKQSTELFSESESGHTRTVLWQTSGTLDHKIEYNTTGKAWERDQFTLTGNVYDLEEGT